VSLQTGTRGSGYMRVGHRREPLSSRKQRDDQNVKDTYDYYSYSVTTKVLSRIFRIVYFLHFIWI